MKLITYVFLTTWLFITFSVFATEQDVLKKFSQYDNRSELIITYDDVDSILKTSVLSTGKSNRSRAKKSKASIGTRMKSNVKRLTSLEGNRFYYESYDTPKKIELIVNIRKSLEYLSAEIPLHLFSKNEQLAYWLNLYNISLLEQLVKIYPEKNLESIVEDGDLLNKKILTVETIKISLNDIKSIVIQNFGYDPLLIYGFHEGYIASPDISKSSYTGKNVWRSLERNADYFINSNRGTYSDGSSTFRVSYLYEKNKNFFPEFDKDLTSHLSKYLLRSYEDKLLSASKIKTNITNWHIADLYGTKRTFGGSVSTNSAALLDAFVARVDANAGAFATSNAPMNTGAMNSNIANYSLVSSRFSPEHLEQLKKLLQLKETPKGSVTVTDIETDEAEENQNN